MSNCQGAALSFAFCLVWVVIKGSAERVHEIIHVGCLHVFSWILERCTVLFQRPTCPLAIIFHKTR